MNMTDLHAEVLACPGACLLLVARARLSAEKHGKPLDVMLADYLSQTAKLRGALHEARGLSLRKVLDVIEDERFDFYRARQKEAEEKEAAAKVLRDFARQVTHTAEGILPGVYFDAMENEDPPTAESEMAVAA
jgi:hypothetical protein